MTYETDEEEEDLKAPSHGRLAVDVAVAHGRHGHHEEVHALPVAQLLRIIELERVALVLQLDDCERQRRRRRQGRKIKRDSSDKCSYVESEMRERQGHPLFGPPSGGGKDYSSICYTERYKLQATKLKAYTIMDSRRTSLTKTARRVGMLSTVTYLVRLVGSVVK